MSGVLSVSHRAFAAAKAMLVYPTRPTQLSQHSVSLLVHSLVLQQATSEYSASTQIGRPHWRRPGRRSFSATRQFQLFFTASRAVS